MSAKKRFSSRVQLQTQPDTTRLAPPDRESLERRREILRKRRAGAGVMMGGRKERAERLRLVDADLAAVDKELARLGSLQGRVRTRRAAEREAGVERGRP